MIVASFVMGRFHQSCVSCAAGQGGRLAHAALSGGLPLGTDCSSRSGRQGARLCVCGVHLSRACGKGHQASQRKGKACTSCRTIMISFGTPGPQTKLGQPPCRNSAGAPSPWTGRSQRRTSRPALAEVSCAAAYVAVQSQSQDGCMCEIAFNVYRGRSGHGCCKTRDVCSSSTRRGAERRQRSRIPARAALGRQHGP